MPERCMHFKLCSFYSKWKLKLQLVVFLAAKVLIFEHSTMSTSSIESLTQDTKDELKEKTLEENNEVELEVLEEKVTMMDLKDIRGDNEVLSNFLRSKKEVKWYMALLGLRIVAFVFCLVAFSILGANEQRVLVNEEITNWFSSGFSVKTPYEFHWYDYDEFRYSFSVNVIGFVYSGLQICYLVRYLVTKKHAMNPKLQSYFNLVIDQALAYILMSASSSAATGACLLRSYWIEHGAHKFIEMANASVAISFFAFVAFALASLVSGFILFRFN
ncbi:unnamed protein product [Lathyrus oleraceus]|uniref:CASP-like protein n=1 Tax=Pisum sativum TaxID=3888 RepID=A0A9D5BF14_PEA|nr:CASP-like protein N24 [Pisum sativum]KAI5442417.1 CASP-like protein n24 [Pisum sativum]